MHTVPFPTDLLETILWQGARGDRKVGDFSTDYFESIQDQDPSTVPLTLAQVGQLFAWAWSDANAYFDPESEEKSLQEALASDRHETADTLRALIYWAAAGARFCDPNATRNRGVLRQIQADLSNAIL